MTVIFCVSSNAQIGSFPTYEQQLNEFLAFQKEMKSLAAKQINVKELDSIIADFELIWWADLEGLNFYGLEKHSQNRDGFVRNKIALPTNVVMYGSDYLMVDIYEPPTGSIHDEVLYYKRNFAHSIDELKSDTIFWTTQQLHKITYYSDTTPIINSIKDNSEYLKFKSDYQIHDTILLSNRIENTNGMTFQLLYVVEEVQISGPGTLNVGGGGTISKGNQLQIRVSDLKIEDQISFSKSRKSELYQFKDYYILKSNWDRIGNTSYYYYNTYYLKLTSPHKVDNFDELLNDSLEKCNHHPDMNNSLPSVDYLNLFEDSLIKDYSNLDSIAHYEILKYSYNEMFQPPTETATYTNCDFYGNGNYMTLKEIIVNIINQYPDLKVQSYNQGKFILLFDSDRYIGNTSHSSLVQYYLRRVD